MRYYLENPIENNDHSSISRVWRAYSDDGNFDMCVKGGYNVFDSRAFTGTDSKNNYYQLCSKGLPWFRKKYLYINGNLHSIYSDNNVFYKNESYIYDCFKGYFLHGLDKMGYFYDGQYDETKNEVRSYWDIDNEELNLLLTVTIFINCLRFPIIAVV